MSIHQSAATGFARGSDAYERGRPSFPADAVAHLAGELSLGPQTTLLDLGAGTGKLTRLLAPLAGRVLVVEPVAEMREKLLAAVPSAEPVAGVAEAIELDDASVEAIVAAQAFHWFDAPAALREMHRVLRPGGGVGLIWNRRDESVAWVARLTELLEPHRGSTPRYADGRWRAAFDETTLFTPLRYRRFSYVQELTRDGVVDRVASISFVAALPDEPHARLLDDVRRLVAEHPQTRGRDRIELPYVTDVYVGRRAEAHPL